MFCFRLLCNNVHRHGMALLRKVLHGNVQNCDLGCSGRWAADGRASGRASGWARPGSAMVAHVVRGGGRGAVRKHQVGEAASLVETMLDVQALNL